MVSATKTAANSGTGKSAVRNAQTIVLILKFVNDMSKRRTLLLEPGVEADEVIGAISTSLNVRDWDTDTGELWMGKGQKRRLLARWITTETKGSIYLPADEANVVVPDDEGPKDSRGKPSAQSVH